MPTPPEHVITLKGISLLLTCVNSRQDALHGVRHLMRAAPPTLLPPVIALRAQVKVIADEALVPLPREIALPTRITADTCMPWPVRGRSADSLTLVIVTTVMQCGVLTNN